MKPYILVVEDEAPLVTLLRYNLEEAGFEVEEATNGEEALICVMERKPDLVILDWMLPMVSGMEVCRQFRRRRDTRDLPVIMLTARTEEGDRIRGLDSGVDDYVTKPFSPRELIARVRAVMRRTRPSISAEKMTFADIEMDLIAYRVTRSGEATHLGPTEFRLLRHFMEHPGRVFSREQLLDSVWGHNVHVEPRTVDVHVRRLRKALNVGKSPDVIRTVRSAGYAMELQRSSHEIGRGLAAQGHAIDQKY